MILRGLFILTLLLSSNLLWAQESENKFNAEDPREVQYSLFFTPEKNNVEVINPVFRFDFTDLSRMKIGNFEFSIDDFQLNNENFGYKYLHHYQVMNVVAFRWPSELLQEGRLSVVDPKGKEIFVHKMNKADQEAWRRDLKRVQNREKIDKYSFGTSTYQKKISLEDFNIGFVESKDKRVTLFRNHLFRFCVEKEKEFNYVKVCSPFLQRLNTGQVVFAKRRVKGFKNSSTINGKELPIARGEVPFINDIQASLQLNNGFEIIARIKKPEVTVAEILKFDDESVMVVGEGQQCLNCVLISRDHIVEYNNVLNYMELFNQGRTYNEPKIYWYKKLDSSATNFSYSIVSAVDAAVYDYDFRNLPEASDKPQILEPKRQATYSDEFTLYLNKPGENYFLESEEKGEVSFDPVTKLATWNVQGLEKGKNNKSYLKIYKGEKPYVLKHNIYRGYPIETSGRVTVISTDNVDTAVLSEVNLSGWAESLFGWENKTWSVQRWGVNVKIFQSLVKFKAPAGGDVSGPIDISSNTVDIKYRLTPGLWNWDESYGFSLSYQDYTFYTANAKMYGLGFIWARSMPKFFDDIFNIIPWFRYPKWVEAEFIYYPFSIDKEVELTGYNYALNYRGKILWTNDIYGEAGFGIKKYDFRDDIVNIRANPFFFYVTGGLGLQF